MTHDELKIFDKFKIEKEPNSIFIKDTNRYDGSVNSYRIKDKFKNSILIPVIFSKDYDVVEL